MGNYILGGLLALGTVSALAIFVLIAPVPAEADITRGCQGSFDIRVIGGDITAPSNTRKKLDLFEARGACKNTAQANTCRSRAKDNVFRCANELWDRRWNLIGDPKDGNADLGLPDICLGRTTGAKKVGPFKENKHGQHFDIKYTIEYNTCCVLQPRSEDLDVKVTVSSFGDKGCGKTKSSMGNTWSEWRTLEPSYGVNCKSLRKQGMCAKRTGG